jgi:SAM-dependent methyltransferase
MGNQKEIFKKTEANNYHERNKDKNHEGHVSYDLEILVETLKPFAKDIMSILELGCANGNKLAYLVKKFEAIGYGVDLSSSALEDARRRYPELKFEHAGADERIFHKNSMDLVYLGFFLYVLDREDVYTTMANVDYYLKAGGFVAIFDFDYGINAKFPYAHNKDITTFKSDYAKILLSSGHYHLVSKTSFQRNSRTFSIDPNLRISLSILFKNQNAYTQEMKY